MRFSIWSVSLSNCLMSGYGGMLIDTALRIEADFLLLLWWAGAGCLLYVVWLVGCFLYDQNNFYVTFLQIFSIILSCLYQFDIYVYIYWYTNMQSVWRNNSDRETYAWTTFLPRVYYINCHIIIFLTSDLNLSCLIITNIVKLLSNYQTRHATSLRLFKTVVRTFAGIPPGWSSGALGVAGGISCCIPLITN